MSLGLFSLDQAASFKPFDWGQITQLWAQLGDRGSTDLPELIGLGSDFDIDLISLNPFHVPVTANKYIVSSYSPSHLRFLNPKYIDPEGMSEIIYLPLIDDQRFRQSQPHQFDALLMITNHDVLTLAGSWDEADLSIRKEIGLAKDAHEFDGSLEQCRQEKHGLLKWLQTKKLLPASWEDYLFDKSVDFNLCSAILIASARSQSRIMLFQLDDFQLSQKPVNNPGTHQQYSNWRRKLKQTTQALFSDPKILGLLSSIYRERIQ